MKRRGGYLAFGVAAFLVITAVVIVAVLRVGDRVQDEVAAGMDCSGKLAEAAAEVRTDRRWTAADLPGIGDYLEIHWQLRAAGDPCSRAPGPTDWRYQGFLRLRPDDARALRTGYAWVPLSASPGAGDGDTPSDVWPALSAHAPAAARWLHSSQYAAFFEQGPRWGDLYLADGDDVAFFVLYDH